MRDLVQETQLSGPRLQTSGPSPLLEAIGLCYGRRDAPLLDGIDLRVHAGRRLVILGENGAGKSLLLRALHGLVAPSAGMIRWRGGPLDRQARRAQAMVFQRAVMLRRSARANLRFALAVRGIGGGERRRREARALQMARLGALADRPARLLSGGEQQRLAIARALACAPELLFLDEPTANLDPASTLAIEDLIRLASQEGITVVLVTHDPGQARRLGEDAMFLHAGRVAEIGSAEDVLDRPQSAAARAWRDGRLYLGPDAERRADA